MTPPTRWIYYVWSWYLKKSTKKAWKATKNSKRAKIIVKIPKIFVAKTRTYVKKYTAGHLCTKFEEFILIYEAVIVKHEFDLLLAVNYDKVTQLWCNSNSTCQATYWMYIPSFKLISQSMLEKVRKPRTDGRTDGRMDWHCHSMICPFLKQAYKKWKSQVQPMLITGQTISCNGVYQSLVTKWMKSPTYMIERIQFYRNVFVKIQLTLVESVACRGTRPKPLLQAVMTRSTALPT